MAYKMKGPTLYGASPLKQSELDVEFEKGKSNPTGKGARTEQFYSSAQRKEMVSKGVKPKDRMEYAARNFK